MIISTHHIAGMSGVRDLTVHVHRFGGLELVTNVEARHALTYTCSTGEHEACGGGFTAHRDGGRTSYLTCICSCHRGTVREQPTEAPATAKALTLTVYIGPDAQG